MHEPIGYPVPAHPHRVEQTIARSRFLCTIERAATADEAQAFVRSMHAVLPDATHHCWAFVAGPPGDTGRAGMSDAGEPHGTAGRPMLTVLLHSGVGEIAAVVTRYYGGIKLGTGGLVKAYGGTVQLALATLPTEQRIDYVDGTLTIGYASITVVRQLLDTFDVVITGERYEADVQYAVRVPRPNVATVRGAVADATRGGAALDLAEE